MVSRPSPPASSSSPNFASLAGIGGDPCGHMEKTRDAARAAFSLKSGDQKTLRDSRFLAVSADSRGVIGDMGCERDLAALSGSFSENRFCEIRNLSQGSAATPTDTRIRRSNAESPPSRKNQVSHDQRVSRGGSEKPVSSRRRSREAERRGESGGAGALGLFPEGIGLPLGGEAHLLQWNARIVVNRLLQPRYPF